MHSKFGWKTARQEATCDMHGRWGDNIKRGFRELDYED
jgi:hypothetical protein